MFNNDLKFIEKASDKLPLSIFDKWHKNLILDWIISFFIYFVPLITLFSFFIRFADYQSLGWSAYHIIIIMFDIVLIGFFKKYFTYTIGVFILSVSMLFWMNMHNFIVEKPYTNIKINELFPKLELTNRNLNKNIDLSLLKAYAEEENSEHPLALLTPVNMRNRNFLYADFSYSKMYRFDFSGSNISYVNFEHTQIPYSIFKNTIANKSNFTMANISHANIENMNAYKSTFGSSNLMQSEIKDVNFTSSLFIESNFSGSRIHRTNFIDANLAKSIFICTICNDLNFTGAGLNFSDFSGSHMDHIILVLARLANTKFIAVDGHDFIIESSFLFHTDFTGVVSTINTKYDNTGRSSGGLIMMNKESLSVDKISQNKSIKRKFIPDAVDYIEPLFERVGFNTDFNSLISRKEYNLKFTLKDLIKKFKLEDDYPLYKAIYEYSEETIEYYLKSKGKNTKQWMKSNEKQIIKGALMEETVNNIIKSMSNNQKALENINYNKENVRQ